ncbi:MAG: sulfotransferase domain-containing protein [Candidatus Nealsonbacteria bacterium]
MKNIENNFKVGYVGIGVRRGGTSWIQQCLAEHPQICGYKTKEFAFLNDPNKCSRGIEAYIACFPPYKPGQIMGEFTPGYIASEEAIRTIKKWFPKAKLLVCFRNPIERAFYHYIFHKAEEKTRAKTFEEAVKDRALKPYYIDTGFYYTQFKKWFDAFPREQFLILIYDDIKKDPLKFIQGVYKFLGVNQRFVPPSLNQQVNWAAKNALKIPLLNFTITKIKRLLFHHPKLFKPLVLPARFLRINKLVEFIRQANCRKEGRKRQDKPVIPEKTRQYLREVYREEIKNFGKLIDKDLSSWLS